MKKISQVKKSHNLRQPQLRLRRRAPFVVQCRRHLRHFPRFAVKLPERKALYVDNRPIGALLPCTYAKKHGENIKNTPQTSCGDFYYLNRLDG